MQQLFLSSHAEGRENFLWNSLRIWTLTMWSVIGMLRLPSLVPHRVEDQPIMLHVFKLFLANTTANGY